MQRRNTNQKQIVFDSLEKLGHASSEMLITYIQKNYSNISLATIYRNLSILLEDNLVKKVKLNTIDVYETVKGNHFHFTCNVCHEIIDIDPMEIPEEIKNLKMVSDNSISSFDLSFNGICKKCQNKIEKC